MRTRQFVAPNAAQNYAASKSSTTVNTAVKPYDLAEGAIGIYGIQKSATNDRVEVLITDGGAESAGVCPAANFVGDSIYFAIGRAEGADKTGDLDVATLKASSQAYSAPVKTVQSVGRTSESTGGNPNFPATIVRGDEALLGVSLLDDPDKQDNAPKKYSGYALSDGASEYSILVDLVKRVIADDFADVVVEVSSDGTPTYLSATQDPTLTNGSIAVSFAAAHGLSEGNVLTIRGRTYAVATVVDTTNIELDYAYQGVSETIDVSVESTVFGTLASINEFGLIVTDKNFDEPVAVSVSGILQSASVNVNTAFSAGNGTGAKVQQAELDARPLYGNLDNRDATVPIKALSTDASLTYDQYLLSSRQLRQGSDPHNTDNGAFVLNEVNIACVSTAADTPGLTQSDLEDILAALGVSVSTLF